MSANDVFKCHLTTAKDGLGIQFCTAQGYDNIALMSSAHNGGVKQKILKIFSKKSKALCTLCANHSLNLWNMLIA